MGFLRPMRCLADGSVAGTVREATLGARFGEFGPLRSHVEPLADGLL